MGGRAWLRWSADEACRARCGLPLPIAHHRRPSLTTAACPTPWPPPARQYDVHLPLLTVRETLTFARNTLYAAGSKHDLADEFKQARA